MPGSLLASQLATLQRDDRLFVVPADDDMDSVTQRIVDALR